MIKEAANAAFFAATEAFLSERRVHRTDADGASLFLIRRFTRIGEATKERPYDVFLAVFFVAAVSAPGTKAKS